MLLLKFNLLSISRLPSSEFLPLPSRSAARSDGSALGCELHLLVLENGPDASYILLLPLCFLLLPSRSFLSPSLEKFQESPVQTIEKL